MNDNNNNMSATTKPASGKRGKPVGQSDTVHVSIETLLKYAPQGVATVIPLRRKWLEQFEQFLGVKFIQECLPVKTEMHETILTEEPLAAERAAVIRPRLEVLEEEL